MRVSLPPYKPPPNVNCNWKTGNENLMKLLSKKNTDMKFTKKILSIFLIMNEHITFSLQDTTWIEKNNVSIRRITFCRIKDNKHKKLSDEFACGMKNGLDMMQDIIMEKYNVSKEIKKILFSSIKVIKSYYNMSNTQFYKERRLCLNNASEPHKKFYENIHILQYAITTILYTNDRKETENHEQFERDEETENHEQFERDEETENHEQFERDEETENHEEIVIDEETKYDEEIEIDEETKYDEQFERDEETENHEEIEIDEETKYDEEIESDEEKEQKQKKYIKKINKHQTEINKHQTEINKHQTEINKHQTEINKHQKKANKYRKKQRKLKNN